MIHTLGVSYAKRGMIMKGVVGPEIGVTMRARRGATGWLWVWCDGQTLVYGLSGVSSSAVGLEKA